MTGFAADDVNSGPPPSITAEAGAGTDPTVSVVGSDRAGEITVTTGTDPQTGLVATIGFNQLPRNASFVYPLISSANVNGFASGVNARRIDDSSWGIYRDNVALAASTTYKWNYFVP